MSRGARRLALAAAPVLLILLVLWWAPGAAFRLVVVRGIPRCDLMLIPGGGAKERIVTGAELLKDGACRKIMITGPFTIEGWPDEEGIPVEVEPGRVVEAPFLTGSTWGDAVASLAVAREHGFDSILVVTSPFHTRRLGWIFDRVLGGTGVRFGVHPSESFYFDYRRWWRSRYGRRVVLGEYLKLWSMGLASVALEGTAAAAAHPAGAW